MKFKYTLFAGFAIAIVACLAVSSAIQAQETTDSTEATIQTVMSTSTERMSPSSTRPEPKRLNPSIFKEDDAEQMIAEQGDSPAVRAIKMARYWSLYRETGSEKIYAITTSHTKREVQTMAFFSAFETNFGMKLMPKGSLEQFATGDAITSIEGLDSSMFRKAPQPCRLLKTADRPAVYLACLGMKRVIMNERAFRQFGWDFKQVEVADAQEIEAMKVGDSVSESTVFEQGVQIDTSRVKQPSAKSDVKKEMPKPSVSSLTTNGARVVKIQGSTKLFLITSDGKRHYLANMDVVRSLKLDLSKLQTITTEQLSAYPEGEVMTIGGGTKESVPPMPSVKPMNQGASSTSMMPKIPERSTAVSSTWNLPAKEDVAKVAFLLKAKGTDGPVYLVKMHERIKHRVWNTAALAKMGLSIQPLADTTQEELDLLQTGESIGTAPVESTMPVTTEATSTNTSLGATN